MVFALSALLLAASAVALGGYYGGQSRAAEKLRHMADLKNRAVAEALGEKTRPAPAAEEETVFAAYGALHAQNPDMVGWLSIPGTNIDYPVMQRGKQYYLDRDFDGAYSPMGLPFVDQRCDVTEGERTVLIYGHNIKSGSLFHDLLQFRDEEFRGEHPLITFDTLEERRTYTVTGVEAFADRDLQPELDEPGDRLILVTCSYHTENGRFAVYAERVETATDGQ